MLAMEVPIKRRLVRDWTVKRAYSSGAVPAGVVITITEVDDRWGKVMVEEWLLWVDRRALWRATEPA